MTDTPLFITGAELLDMPLPDPLCKYVAEHDCFVITWGGYEYSIAADRISNPLSLVQWLAHLGEKEWKEMTPWRTHIFITLVCRVKGWRVRL